MKNIQFKTAVFCAALLVISGCKKVLDPKNENPYGANSELLSQDFNNIKSLFSPMFNNVIHTQTGYQTQQGLQGDVWSGYMATPTDFRGGSNNTTYDLVDGWNNTCWNYAYTGVMANALKIEQRAKGKYDQFYALSLIIKVEAMHRITDTFGPIVYTKYGTTDAIIPYDSQEEAYNAMFADLESAITILTNKISAKEASTFVGTDITVYAGNYTKWVMFANSLRLRMAMRIVKVNPALAKTQAEKSIAHPIGVLVANADVCKVISPTLTNPISTISGSWDDIRMSADMESILVGYADPRVANYFLKSSAYPDYKGIRTGIQINAKSDRVSFSKIGAVIENKETVWMTTAEVYFLRAEGALRGWNMNGTAKGLYEAGIASSFEQRGISGAATYAADNVKLPKAYVDPVSAVNNAAALNNVTIAWDAAASNEVNLQKIITQKWIAGFPDGQEAWSEYRRTGYPKIFPVIKNTSGGKIDSATGIRRINFVESERSGNPGGVATALTKLGGPDNGGTRLWWDVAGPNF